MISIVLLILSLTVWPLAYVALCRRMKKEGVQRPPYVAYFFIFGTVGGWFLAMALSPSGLAATCTLALMTAAPLALLSSAIAMTQEQERSIYHRIVLWTGFGYPGLLASLAAFAALYSHVT